MLLAHQDFFGYCFDIRMREKKPIRIFLRGLGSVQDWCNARSCIHSVCQSLEYFEFLKLLEFAAGGGLVYSKNHASVFALACLREASLENFVLVYSRNQLIMWVHVILWNMKPAQTVPVAILVRVSTNRQETSRQIHDLQAVADAKGWNVVEVCQETVSGSANIDDRPALKRVLELAETGKIKKVLVHEVSRVARRPSVAMTFVEMLEAHCVSLYWHAQSIETLLPNCKRNPAAAIMLALLSEMARAEKDTLRERIMSGLAEARRKGSKLGRPEGTTLEAGELLSKHKDIVRLLKDGHSVRNAAKIAGKGSSTVQRVKAALAVA